MPLTTDGSAQGFEFKNGNNDFPSWAGENRDGNPTAIARNQFQELINVVHDGAGDLKDRPGQSKFNSAALASGATPYILGIADIAPKLGAPGGLLFPLGNTTGTGTTNSDGDYSQWRLADRAQGLVQVGPPIPKGTLLACHAGMIYSASGPSLGSLAVYNPVYDSVWWSTQPGVGPYGTTIWRMSRSLADERIYGVGRVFPGLSTDYTYLALYEIPSGNIVATKLKTEDGGTVADDDDEDFTDVLCSATGQVYVAYANRDDTTSGVYRLSGGALVLEDSPGNTQLNHKTSSRHCIRTVHLFEANDMVFAGYSNTTTGCRVRRSNGTWFTALVTDSTGTARSPWCFAEYNNVVYCGLRGNPIILSYNTGTEDFDTTLKYFGTTPLPGGDYGDILAMAVLENKLYVVYQIDGDLNLTSWDGSAWAADVSLSTDLDSSITTYLMFSDLRPYNNGLLFSIGYISTSGFQYAKTWHITAGRTATQMYACYYGFGSVFNSGNYYDGGSATFEGQTVGDDLPFNDFLVY